MVAPLIDHDHRRRLVVARHLLGSPGRSDRAVADVTATHPLLHSTDPSTPHLSVHARSGATISDIDDAFYERRDLLRHTTVRRTVFAMPLDVVPLAHGAANALIVAKLRGNLVAWIDASPDTAVPGGRFLDDVESEVVEFLRSSGPASGAAMSDAIAGLRIRFDPAPGKAYSRPMRITSKVLEILAAEGRIARGRPTGRDFTSGSWTWEPAERWVGPDGIDHVEPADALAGLIDRHLATHAPATLTDIAWWTGIAKTRVRAALTAIDAVEVRLDGVDEPGFVRADDDLEAPASPGAVALLPGLDATTMGWKQRAWYVDDRPEAGLFDRNGNAGPTIWIDGRVVGTWTQRPDGSIVTLVGEDVGSAERTEIDREVERTTTWLAGIRVKWRYPTQLTRQLEAD